MSQEHEQLLRAIWKLEQLRRSEQAEKIPDIMAGMLAGDAMRSIVTEHIVSVSADDPSLIVRGTKEACEKVAAAFAKITDLESEVQALIQELQNPHE